MGSMVMPFGMTQCESSLRGRAGPSGVHSLGTGRMEEVLMASSGVWLRDVALFVWLRDVALFVPSGSLQSPLVYHSCLQSPDQFPSLWILS